MRTARGAIGIEIEGQIYYTPKEVAEIKKVNKRTVFAWTYGENTFGIKLQKSTVNGFRSLISETDLETFFAEIEEAKNGRKSPPSAPRRSQASVNAENRRAKKELDEMRAASGKRRKTTTP